MNEITLVDPLGRCIRLHDRTWYGHILRGHPELTALRVEVELAVKCPEEIRFSRVDEQCRQYYSFTLNNGLRIVVVIDIGLALVKTAYLAKKIKGADVEWSQQTQ